jgi:hypothetical protein
MIDKIYDKPDIYNIYVPLPNNPLKSHHAKRIQDSFDIVKKSGS